jgi:hypothetical protein
VQIWVGDRRPSSRIPKADQSVSLFVERGQWPERDRQDQLRFDVGLVFSAALSIRVSEPAAGFSLMSANTDVLTCSTPAFSPAESPTATRSHHVLVNNAGYSYRAAVEESDDPDIRRWHCAWRGRAAGVRGGGGR